MSSPPLASTPASRTHPRGFSSVHPSTASILRHFTHAHLPPHLAKISAPICELAHAMAADLDGTELTAGLRKLLEAKDCFVRAAVEQAR